MKAHDEKKWEELRAWFLSQMKAVPVVIEKNPEKAREFMCQWQDAIASDESAETGVEEFK